MSCRPRRVQNLRVSVTVCGRCGWSVVIVDRRRLSSDDSRLTTALAALAAVRRSCNVFVIDCRPSTEHSRVRLVRAGGVHNSPLAADDQLRFYRASA